MTSKMSSDDDHDPHRSKKHSLSYILHSSRKNTTEEDGLHKLMHTFSSISSDDDTSYTSDVPADQSESSGLKSYLLSSSLLKKSLSPKRQDVATPQDPPELVQQQQQQQQQQSTTSPTSLSTSTTANRRRSFYSENLNRPVAIPLDVQERGKAPMTMVERSDDDLKRFHHSLSLLPANTTQTQTQTLPTHLYQKYLLLHAGQPSAYQSTFYHVIKLDHLPTLKLILHDLGIQYILRNLSKSFPQKRSVVWIAAYFGASKVLAYFIDQLKLHIYQQCLHQLKLNDSLDQDEKSSSQIPQSHHADTTSDLVSQAIRTTQANLIEELQRPSQDGIEPLIVAATKNHPSIIRLLIHHGVKITNPKNASALAYIASSFNHMEILRILSEQVFPNDEHYPSQSYFCLPDEDGMVPLLLASQYGHTDVLRYFFDCNRRKNFLVDFRHCDKRGFSCVAIAALYDQHHIIRYLSSIHDTTNLDAPDINQRINNEEYDEETPLHLAVRKMKLSAIRALIESKNCAITARNRQGQTVLHIAASQNLTKSLKVLIQSLPKSVLVLMDSEDITGSTPIHIASLLGYVESVKLLAPISNLGNICSVSNMKPISSSIPNRDQPVLITATIKNHVNVVSALLEAGADINGRDEMGHTAIGIAARLGYYEMCELLVRRGADLTLQSKKGGGTPLYKAKRYKKTDVVELLQKHTNF